MVLFNPSLVVGDKEIHILPKGISVKVNAIVRFEFEPVYNDVSVKHVSHYISSRLYIQEDTCYFSSVHTSVFTDNILVLKYIC